MHRKLGVDEQSMWILVVLVAISVFLFAAASGEVFSSSHGDEREHVRFMDMCVKLSPSDAQALTCQRWWDSGNGRVN